MNANAKLAYAILGALIASHVIYRFIQRRIRARHLPPKFWTFEPFKSLDWVFLTAMFCKNHVKFQTQLGPTYRVPTLWNPMSAISTCDPDNIQAMLSGKDWGVGFRLTGMRDMLGVGVITTDGNEWMRSRKMMRPAFNRPNIDGPEIIEKVSDELLHNIDGNGETVDMQVLVYDAFMTSSMQFILGIDAKNEEDGRPISVETFNKLWSQGVLGMGLRLLFENLSWVLPKAQFLSICRRLHSFVDFAINQSNMRSSSATEGNRKSMADILLSQTDDEKDVRYNLMHTILANQDTTGVLTMNTIELLADHPTVWKQLRSEVQSKAEDPLTYDALKENTLIRNIQFESLRIRPVFPAVGRRALVDTTIPTGGGPKGDEPLHIPAGTMGIVNLWALNLNPVVFGPDSHIFNPDRWNSIKPSSKEFVPFGSGARSCLGKDKALFESAYLLAKLAERFEDIEARGSKYSPRADISMKNADGCKVAFWRVKE